MSDYSIASRAPLKLKGIPMKKKKKKKIVEEPLVDKLKKGVNKSDDATDQKSDVPMVSLPEDNDLPYTKAQLSFFKMQEKIQAERAMQKASKSHRQRVEDFNRKLDEMTEHYDIPKVSWTK
ncbi:protein FAM32A-like [Brevipalpus obovatus]|uniref:protein FAM32A-like n=1 Tax=Brevipalpus obovatus TaxID=246614 RepID=UPI003D9E51AC